MSCTFADDTYLVTAWPGVVLRTGERWLVGISAAVDGMYTVTMRGLPYQFAATVPGDDTTDIRDGLLVPLGAQVAAAVSPQGLTGILLQEVVQPGVVPSGLGVTVSGPAVDTIEATLISGGDSNEAARLYWLEAVKCGMPPCSAFTCKRDFTVAHAALAAHWIYSTMPQNVGSTGAGANDFDRMRLGPAELSRGESSRGAVSWGQGGNTADADLARTAPGRLFLAIRRRYIFPVMCA